MGRRWAILLTSIIRKVCKFVHFTGGEKVSSFAHFYQESVQICSLYWWGEGEQFCSLLSGKCANLFTLLVGRTSIRKVCKLVHFTGERTSIRKVCKFVHFTGGENFYQASVQTCSLYWWENFYQESVQIFSLYWWGEGEQFCSLLSGKCANLFTLLVGRRWAILLTSIRKVCKFVHFTGGEKVSNFAHFNQESVQICSLYWWGEGEQFCSLQSGKCANLFTLLVGRRWAILLTSIRKVCKFVHFTGGEKVSNFAHFNQESVQICSLYWWGEGEQFCSLQSGKCANLFTLLVGRWAILLTSVRKVCKFVHFTGGEVSNFAHFNQENVHVHFTGDGEKVSNFAHFNQESVQICSLYWWERGEQYSAHFSHEWGRWANLYTHWGGREICTHWIIFCCFLSTRSQICKKLIRKFAHL